MKVNILISITVEVHLTLGAVETRRLNRPKNRMAIYEFIALLHATLS